MIIIDEITVLPTYLYVQPYMNHLEIIMFYVPTTLFVVPYLTASTTPYCS